MNPALLVGLMTVTFVVATPSAFALPDCVVGDESCIVEVETRVCVTDPCETLKVCINSAAICARFYG